MYVNSYQKFPVVNKIIVKAFAAQESFNWKLEFRNNFQINRKKEIPIIQMDKTFEKYSDIPCRDCHFWPPSWAANTLTAIIMKVGTADILVLVF